MSDSGVSTEDPKVLALAELLECDAEDITEDGYHYDRRILSVGSAEYVVLTDDEADEMAEEDIEQSLFAFRPEFLLSYMPEGMTTEALEAIAGKLYEDASPAFRSMIGDRWDEFVQDAISADGRGHFLNRWDGSEEEAGDFYVVPGELMYVSDDDYDVCDQQERASLDVWAWESPAFYAAPQVSTVERRAMPTDSEYLEMARQDYQDEDCVILHDPAGSFGSHPYVQRVGTGAWVLARVWVSDDRFEED